MAAWVYSFSQGAAEGAASMKDLLGGKGANLAEMAALDLPVPPGFTLTTEVCSYFYANGGAFPEGLEAQVDRALAGLEAAAGRKFGDAGAPLLVSVRSGAKASMPGMMDTILNLGLNDQTVEALAAQAGERFAYDCYRRLIEMYGSVVLAAPHEDFEHALDKYKERRGIVLDARLSGADWREIVAAFKAIVAEATGEIFPQNPREQLWGAIKAVFSSWMNQRAQTYRRLHGIPESWGTAVTVQAMVFGNLDDSCATGVAFSRNPSTGARELFGEFLINAQGEDVVAGLRTPQPLSEVARRVGGASEAPSLEAGMPAVYAQFRAYSQKLETHFRDMQDMEFTVERGKLWMLQTRAGKRTTPAALKIAVDMANEGLLSREEALLRVDPASLEQLLHPTLDPEAKRAILASGLPASPGAATGQIVFDTEEAQSLANAGKKVILVRVETSPEDIGGMHAAQGVLTSRGGMTSHAAVVARGMGRPCVTGASAIRVDYDDQSFTVLGRRFAKGDIITIDGSAGQVISGEVKMHRPELTGEFAVLMGWADRVRRLKVRANAETPADARAARRFGAEGIGLARTEHMFFEGERIVAVREMILADDAEGRRAALAKLLPIQREDFIALFEIMAGLPVTIRLLDPPLHEFLPHSATEIAAVAKAMGADPQKLRRRAQQLSEFNPMLGFRGVRLAVLFPEIVDMQARAIFEAAIAAAVSTGAPARIEIMAPLVFTRAELDLVKARIDETALRVEQETGVKPRYKIGTMIELPRAALCAGEIAKTAQFLSFGTNDLTQTTLGISRDDSAQFLTPYREKDILTADPFVTLDQEGVGELVRLGAERGRAARPDIEIGVCGEHGGDAASIVFFEKVGVDYISCSPFRVPIARLAAAQATLGEKALTTA